MKLPAPPTLPPAMPTALPTPPDILTILAIGVCTFFAYNISQAANKKQVNEKQDELPERRHML